MESLNNSISELTWPDVRKEVKQVNPELAAIIDKIDPGKNFKLIKVSYRFGDYILKNGQLFVPDKHRNLISIQQADKKLRDQLTYSAIPLFFTLKNCNEVFIDTSKRIIPLNFLYPGSTLGLFESLDFLFNYQSNPKWSVSAGARSIFMLPKINRIDGFNRLRLNYGLSSDAKLQAIADHWDVFRQIANNPKFTQPWNQEVLFFNKEWLKHNSGSNWVEFYNYLYKQGWHQAQFLIGKIIPSLSWEYFIDAIALRGLKPTPYLTDQIRHIMLIATGKWPGFRPTHNEQVAPIEGIQEAFINTYSIKQHYPTIMHALPLSQQDKLPVYYSLAFPTLLEGSPHNESSATLMLMLRDIRLYLKILSQSLIDKTTMAENFLNNIEFAYFHVEPDRFNEILLSTEIPKDDNYFLTERKAGGFCYSSPFWRGCVRISAI